MSFPGVGDGAQGADPSLYDLQHRHPEDSISDPADHRGSPLAFATVISMPFSAALRNDPTTG